MQGKVYNYKQRAFHIYGGLFYKVDKSRSSNKESTGLGLYIVKTIIKNHGGVITVSSVENQFTAFEFTLPIR